MQPQIDVWFERDPPKGIDLRLFTLVTLLAEGMHGLNEHVLPFNKCDNPRCKAMYELISDIYEKRDPPA